MHDDGTLSAATALRFSVEPSLEMLSYSSRIKPALNERTGGRREEEKSKMKRG